jgi:hypothetical protein
MSDSTPPKPPQNPKDSSVQTADPASSQKDKEQPTPLRCFTGAVIAGGMATALYFLTASIAETFASKPLPSGNYLATNIAVAVRTLVVGMSSLGTGIFGIAALGLVALGIQLLVQQLRQPSA